MRKNALYLFCLFLWVAGCENAPPIVLHPPKIGITTLRYFDPVRTRPLITEVWYPVEEEVTAHPVSGIWRRCPEARNAPLAPSSTPYPLIIISHGYGGDRMTVAWLAEVLAANGYIVAAMDHYGNTWNNKNPEGGMKIWERPQDVSFVIDALFAEPLFANKFDRNRVGFIGYSLGGQTGVWIVGGQICHFEKPSIDMLDRTHLSNVSQGVLDSIDFSPIQASYKDERVAAAFLMAPALGSLFDERSLESVRVPVYIIASENDEIVPPEKNGALLASKMQGAIFDLIRGAANHYVFLNEVSKGGKTVLSHSLPEDHPSVNRGKIHEEIARKAVPFFNRHLRAS